VVPSPEDDPFHVEHPYIFLAKPAALVYYTRHRYRRFAAMARTIAVVNQKGGVGKTTTAVNLAAELGIAGSRVLLCDLDPQGNATSGVGHPRDDRDKNVYALLAGKIMADAAVAPTAFRNLSLLPSHPDLTGAEVELVGMLGREFILKERLAPLSPNFDYIIIDCPPSLNILVINALTAAGSILLPIQCEYYALEGLSLLVNTVALVRERLNPHLYIEGVVMTMRDARTNLSTQVIEEVRNYFREQLFTTVIPRNVRLSEAPSFGQPAVYYDPESSGAAAYRELARELVARALPGSMNRRHFEAGAAAEETSQPRFEGEDHGAWPGIECPDRRETT